MPKVRKFVAYRRIERAYTRRSKFKGKAYIKVTPVTGVIRFVMGDSTRKKTFGYKISLKSKKDLQIRNLAIESGRQSANRVMEKEGGKTNYRMTIRIFPHHILRENPLAAGAGADRMSTGMKHSFGKPIGVAARVKKGQIIMEVSVNKTNMLIGKKALHRASLKLPMTCQVVVE